MKNILIVHKGKVNSAIPSAKLTEDGICKLNI